MEEVKVALSRRLDDPRFDFEPVGTRIGGNVISPTFAGMRDRDRQRLMWDALDEAFGAMSVRHVSTLLAFTPEEWEFSTVPDGQMAL